MDKQDNGSGAGDDLNKKPAGGDGGDGNNATDATEDELKHEDGDDGEQVTLTRGQVNKLKATARNYKGAAQSWFEHKKNNKGNKDLGGDGGNTGAGKDKKPDAGAGQDGGNGNGGQDTRGKEGEFVTKAEQRKRDEKEAITIATTVTDKDDETTQAVKADIDAHFDDIKTFYKPPPAGATPKEIAEALFDAHAAWKRRNPGNGEDRRAAAEIGTSRTTGNGKPSGGKPKPSEKKLWPSSKGGMETWFPKK